MSGASDLPDDRNEIDVGAYCRDVERHLTQVNGGHLVRIVGPAFELVRGWAEAGVPLGVVRRGISAKAERHAIGRDKRPLRVEFCAGDVRAIYGAWRRAVGVHGLPSFPREADAAGAGEEGDADSASADPAVERSLSRDLGRALERLAVATGRLDLPETLRDALDGWIAELGDLRAKARRARGDARQAIAARLPILDAAIGDAAERLAPERVRADARREAEADLGRFRRRMPNEAWEAAVDRLTRRLVRERLSLPTLGP